MNAKKQAMHGGSGFLAPLLAAACFTLAGCGGPALLREPHPLESSQPVAAGKDERIFASIDAVILPNGPGAWVRDAVWDEYLIRIRALSDEEVQIRAIAIFDALDNRVEPRSDGRQLLEGTRETGAAAGYPFAPLPTNALGAILMVPALLFDAVVGGTTYQQVNSEIQRRRTRLPVTLQGGGETNVDLFFPRSPRSERAEVVYVDRHGEHRLDIDMRDVLTIPVVKEHAMSGQSHSSSTYLLLVARLLASSGLRAMR